MKRSITNIFILLMVSAMLLPLVGKPASATSPLSMDMIRIRGEAALMSHYNGIWAVDDTICTSFRPASDFATMLHICRSQSNEDLKNSVWGSKILPGQAIGLFPLNDVAQNSAPDLNSAMPPKYDAGFLRVTRKPSEMVRAELLNIVETNKEYQ